MGNLEILSPREKDVVDLLMKGKSNKQIAYSLGISERTVEFHLRNIFEKTGVNSRVELILKLGKSSATTPGEPVKPPVDGDLQRMNNGRQTDTSNPSDSPKEDSISVENKESSMFGKLATILPPFVILMGIALIVGGMITQKYGAVVVGISTAGGAVLFWIEALKKTPKSKS